MFYLVAAIFFIIGYLVRYQKMYYLIAGYKARAKKGPVANPERLARDTLWMCIVLGILFLIIPFVFHIPYAPPIILGIALIYSIFAVFRANIKYELGPKD